MGPADTRRWAKEEILSAVDARLRELRASGTVADVQDEEALVRQRNRVAALFGEPPQDWWHITDPRPEDD